MEPTKFVLKSKTIIGILIAAAPVVLSLFGVQIDVDEVKALGDTVTAIVDRGAEIITLGGLALATYGRLKANKNLTVTK